ncbi:MAG: HslU--HslV peptidase proteolytic subunit, partial [Treponema sp.]|nr:HslU--HslV peptidase proteolytic subunit [Treponema sp.]
MSEENKIRSTTVLAVKRNGRVAMAGDGQVTAGNTVVKGNARKVRKIYGDK